MFSKDGILEKNKNAKNEFRKSKSFVQLLKFDVADVCDSKETIKQDEVRLVLSLLSENKRIDS